MEINNENNDVNTDPDVNINSWIFIENPTLNEPVNTEIRIQQITEDDLRISDSNSDSDGISVISENESLQSQDECITCLSEIKEQDGKEIHKNIISHYDYEESNYTNTDSLENLQIMPKDSAVKNKIIYITTVTGMCFLATYFLWPKTVISQEYVTDKIIEQDINTDMTNNDILTDVYDKQIWNYYEDFNNTCDLSVDLSQNKLHDFNFVNNFMDQTYSTIKKDIFVKNNKNIQRQKDIKSANSNKKDNKKFKNKKNKSLILKEDYLNKKDKYLIKKEKYLRKIERQINMLEAKLHQAYRRMKKEGGNYLNKNKEKVNSKKPTLQNITGDWYQNMYSGRSEFRYKEKLSDWVFDRSKMRSKLREKETWYFSRVKGREQFRSNEKFYSGKYKIYKSYRY